MSKLGNQGCCRLRTEVAVTARLQLQIEMRRSVVSPKWESLRFREIGRRQKEPEEGLDVVERCFPGRTWLPRS